MAKHTDERLNRLLPCPFCGGKPELLSLGDDYYVHCVDCEVQQIANYRPRIAAARWNMRQPVEENK